MDGAHDMGGMLGFGPVPVEAGGPVFKADWERRVFGCTFAGLGHGLFNVDENRYSRERLPPAAYLCCSYFELWLAALEGNLAAAGVLTREEVDARARAWRAGNATTPAPRSMPEFLAGMRAAISGGISPERPASAPPRFAVGQRVRSLPGAPRGHTRLPRYARGRPATVDRVLKAYVFPDSNAHGGGEQPQHVYSIRFAARDLFGAAADPNQSLNVDVWEAWLEPVG